MRVDRAFEVRVYFPDVRHHVEGLETKEFKLRNQRDFNGLNEDYMNEGEFFIVDDRDLEHVVGHLARSNPGKEIRVYDMVSVSVCPAGEMVTKKVSKDGVLPS